MLMLRKCLCTDLKSGGVILGWLGATFSFLYVVMGIVTLVNINAFISKQDPDTQKLKPEIISFISTNVAFAIINLLASSLLIYGTIKHKRLLLVPWLIDNLLSILFTGIIILISGIILIFSEGTLLAAIVLLIAGCGVSFVSSYFWLVIYSLYREFKEEEEFAERLLSGHGVGTTQTTYSTLA